MKIRNWWNIIQISDEEERSRATTLFLKDLYNILNKGFTLDDNAKGALIEVSFTATNTDTQIRHQLDFVPSNYLVCGSSVAMQVYDGSATTDRTYVYLRSTAIGTARVFIF